MPTTWIIRFHICVFNVYVLSIYFLFLLLFVVSLFFLVHIWLVQSVLFTLICVGRYIKQTTFHYLWNTHIFAENEKLFDFIVQKILFWDKYFLYFYTFYFVWIFFSLWFDGKHNVINKQKNWKYLVKIVCAISCNGNITIEIKWTCRYFFLFNFQMLMVFFCYIVATLFRLDFISLFFILIFH